MRSIKKSQKLEHVCYDIRGPILEEAKRLEDEGYKIEKLNIGNPAPFGFATPDEMVHDIVINITRAEGYADSKGIFSARKAIVNDFQEKGIKDVSIEDVYIGNGVSELIVMAMQGLLDNGDEVLIPAPDYPLWTAAVNLAGGNPVHYLCDEKSAWYPDLEDIEHKISSKTKGLVIISPNNPTGSVYPPEIVKKMVGLANEHGLVVFSDEIYERIVFDGAKHTPPALYADKTLCVSFNGLSKAYRAAGFRAGWMLLSGANAAARDYREGIDILSNMRLCSNVPSQYAIQAALGGYQSIDDLVAAGGRLYEQMEIGWKQINSIPGLSCVRPQGALYLFPRIDVEQFSITSDEQFVLDLLREKKILVVQGTGFNWPHADHCRIVFLPPKEELRDALDGLKEFMTDYRQFLTR